MEIRKTLANGLAKKIITQYGYSVPIDPIKFSTEILGYTIHMIDAADGISAFMVRNKLLIGINKNIHPNRQRFSVAHELGHHYLHANIFDFKDTEDSFKDLRNPMEAEANIFASEFLIPSQMLINEFTKCKDSKILAKKFMVSNDAMWVKILQLNLI